MSFFKLKSKIIIQLFFVIIFFSTSQAKNTYKFNKGNHIANYFAGILSFNSSDYEDSYRYLKKLEGLEEIHLNYSSKYIYSLVNLGKYNEALRYAKKLEKKNLDNFDSNLIIGIYHFKNKKYELANEYFFKLSQKKTNFVLNDFLISTLLNWSNFHKLDFQNAKMKLDNMQPKFDNLINIQKVFLNCFYDDNSTEINFKKLIFNKKTDFTRYNYFLAEYLLSIGKIEEAKIVIKEALTINPRNLLINQFNFELENNKTKEIFNCKNQSHVIAEIFYLTANALSSQSIYTFSNYYLNLAKYLNSDFKSFNTLLAENFYNMNELNKSLKIYENIEKQGAIFSWHAVKQKARILIKEKKAEEALKLLKAAYKKLPVKNIYETFEYAEFLKNNEKFESAIQYYSKILEKIKNDHPLYPEITDGRGVSYERVGQWDKAEKDLLSSLKVSPDQAYVINYLAYSWIEKGIKIKQSLKMLENANKLKSNDPYIIDSLGWALFKLKDYENSKNYLQRAVQLMPADPIVNDHYGDVLWKKGDEIQARYYWNYALSLDSTKKDLKKNIKNKLISGL